MNDSLNATFYWDGALAGDHRSRGDAIMHFLATGFCRRGWQCDKIEDWRDAGLLLPISRNRSRVNVVICPYVGDQGRWIMQIAPARFLGLLLRWVSSAGIASGQEAHQVALATHELLEEAGCYGVQWCWNDLADTDSTYPTPPPFRT